MTEFTKVSIAGPKKKLTDKLRLVIKDVEAGRGYHWPVEGSGPADNVLLVFSDDDFGEGEDAPVLAELSEGEE